MRGRGQHAVVTKADFSTGIAEAEFDVRRDRLYEAMDGAGLDALIAYSTAPVQANVRYLTNYSILLNGLQGLEDGSSHMFGSTACLLAPGMDPVLLIDQPWDVARAGEVSSLPNVAYAPLFAEHLGPIIERARVRRVGIDNWYLFPAREYLALRDAAPQTAFVPTDVLSQLRRVKSPGEIELIRRAAKLADLAVETALSSVRPGTNEYEVVLLCEQVMREGGDIQLGAGSIGGCGTQSSTGSHMPGRDEGRTIAAGEWMMLDVCPRVHGYCGDISRVRVAGAEEDLDPRLRRLLRAAILINEEVRKAVRPGVSGRMLNSVADEVARGEGILQNKVELLGHGIGMDVVDAPCFYFDESPLSPGEVITIEPCLLQQGVGGVRIEDMVLVTEQGGETLTALDRGAEGSSAF
jgi:Xaa-Pro aminopeptidase